MRCQQSAKSNACDFVNGGDGGGGDDEACGGDEVDAEEHRTHVAAADEMKTAAVAVAQMLNSEVVDQSAMFEMRKNRHCLSSPPTPTHTHTQSQL